MNRNTLYVLSVFVLIVFVLTYFSKKVGSTQTVDLKFSDYDGDDYQGTESYLGDSDSLDKGRGRNAYARPTDLYKVSEQANILKLDKNKKGKLSVIKTGRTFNKGVQIRVFRDTIKNPFYHNSKPFVEFVDKAGNMNYINLEKIEKV